MATDIHVRIICKDYNKNIWSKVYNINIWKEVVLYHKENEKMEPVNIYPFRNYELFDILSGNEHDGYKAMPIVIDDLPDSIKQEIKEYQQDFAFDFREITLADLQSYLYKVPKIRDDEEDTLKDNPVKFFVERITQYLDFAEPYWDECLLSSNIRILYWFDN